MSDNEALIEAIRSALVIVIDPELGESVIDLGLIYEIDVREGGGVHVLMTTTTRGCPATGYLKQAVADCVWAVPGVEFVEVELTYDPHWSPAMMSPLAAARLGH
jgi:metal-sulfur cluster biosynthetic enzyme